MESRIIKRVEYDGADDSLVVKSNDLVNARYDLTVFEMRLILIMISQIDRDDEDFKTYRIRVQDIVDGVGTQSKASYEQAREITKRLITRVLQIEQPDGLLQLSWLSSAKYYDGKGYVDLSFDPQLKPYLLALKNRFTKYDLRYILKLRSFYSMRMYELLKQFETLGERTFTVDDLRSRLAIGDSYSYGIFKLRVLTKSQQDLEAFCDISFSFDEIKTGKKVTHLKFFIQSNTPNKKALTKQSRITSQKSRTVTEQPDTQHNTTLIDDSVMLELLQGCGISKKSSQELLSRYGHQRIKDVVIHAREQLEKGKIRENFAGYVRSLLEKESPLDPIKKAPPRIPNPPAKPLNDPIKDLQREFDEMRNGSAETILRSIEVNEDELHKFRSHVMSEYSDNSFILNRYRYPDGSWKEIDMKKDMLFKHYIKQQYLQNYDEHFTLWAAERGVTLVKQADKWLMAIPKNTVSEEPR